MNKTSLITFCGASIYCSFCATSIYCSCFCFPDRKYYITRHLALKNTRIEFGLCCHYRHLWILSSSLNPVVNSNPVVISESCRQNSIRDDLFLSWFIVFLESLSTLIVYFQLISHWKTFGNLTSYILVYVKPSLPFHANILLCNFSALPSDQSKKRERGGRRRERRRERGKMFSGNKI